MTREDWLMRIAKRMTPWIELLNGRKMGPLRASCGWPVGKVLGQGRRVVGQCWPVSASKDGTSEVFISPFLSDPLEVAHTLLHEMVHAAVGCREGHRGKFRRVMIELGFEGQMTASIPGKKLEQRLNALIKAVGKYPHATLDMTKRKKDGIRLIKGVCEQCGYTVRLTRKWIQFGFPICPTCGIYFEEG